MRKIILLTIWACCAGSEAVAQGCTVKGRVTDSAGAPVAYATVALLHKSDSTLRYYGITSGNGLFNIKGVVPDSLLLQVASLEYQTLYRQLAVNGETDLQQLMLLDKAHLLEEVAITGERIPLLIKGDTVEYNAGAYRTKPDAVVEDLLRKMPGIEVDRAGNIKAQGDGVNKVLVDGKEFFGNDPKVATKNLPADAIDKVQVFDRKSDAALFTGMDDGRRDKTINLALKEGKKSGHFGALQAGGGTDDRYRLHARLYQFRKKTQLAVLGMLNNVNEFGFSLDDYFSFQGGMRALMGAGGNLQMRMNSDDNLPVNFGQQVTGLITSGAGGLNYTWEPGNGQRFNISYLGNGTEKQLGERTYSRNFSTGNSFEREEYRHDDGRNYAHRINLSGRGTRDSILQLSFDGGVSLLQRSLYRKLSASSFIEQNVLNSLDSRLNDQGSGVRANGILSLIRKWKGKYPALRFGTTVDYRKSLSETEWLNVLRLTGGTPATDQQFRDDRTNSLAFEGELALARSLGRGYFIEPGIAAGRDRDALQRQQGYVYPEVKRIDSLSPDFERSYDYLRTMVTLQRSLKQQQLRLGLAYESGWLGNRLGTASAATAPYSYWLPSMMWRKDFGRGKNLELSYRTRVDLPAARELLPVVNTADPLSSFTGNAGLRPEYQHQGGIHYLRFDEFNFSSLFFNLTGRYTSGKISYARTIGADLRQQVSLINMPDDYLAEGRVEYSAPFRKLGITYSAALSERYIKGMSLVNGTTNYTNSFSHEAELKLGNRRKEKWDIQLGALISYTEARYSLLPETNNYFYTIGYTADLSYRPSERWYFSLTADVNNYHSKSFDNTVRVPVLKAEAGWYFLKYKRGSLVLNGFDLLNANTGLQRISELNYLMERRSNIIGRYMMLSFKYRLSKAGERKGVNVMTIGK